MKYNFYTASKEMLGDMYTPVCLYLKLRDIYPESALLESSDFHGGENSLSYIALCPAASIGVNNREITSRFPDGSREIAPVRNGNDIAERITGFLERLNVTGDDRNACGVFGYTAFDAVRYFEDIDTNYVGVDNIRGGYLATSHLIRLGHRRIAHLYGSRGSANDGRLAGYRQALSDNEIPCNEKWIRRFEDLALKSGGSRFEPDVECGYENMKHLLRFSEIPTAVFAGNDYQALGAVKAIKEQRLRIPEDIAIVGFDELTINPFLEIPLTTIRQPQYEIGRNAVEILLRKIAEQDTGKRASTERIILPVELVIGASCGAKCRKRRHGWA